MAKYHAWTENGSAHYIDTEQKLWIREAAGGELAVEPTEITWIGRAPVPVVGHPLVALWINGKDSEGNGKAFMRATTKVVHFEELDD